MQTINLRELERLRGLKLNIRRTLSYNEGSRRSSAKGRSAEFSGYREYIPGDDMRYVDWNAYARLDKLYIKEYMEEREGRVNIYLDTSRSMEFGEKFKSTLMAEITEAISFVALSGRDSVYVTDLKNPLGTIRIPAGENGMVLLRNWLQNITPGGRINLVDSLRSAVRTNGGRSFIISDFMDEDFMERKQEALRLMSFRRMETCLIHILSKEELEIEDTGSFRFIDSENEKKDIRLTLERNVVQDYNRALNDYIASIKTAAHGSGADYILCRTDEPLSKIFFDNMRGIW